MLKKVFKILAIIAIVIVVFLIWALRKVDYRPYFHSEYYQNTRAELDNLLNENSLSTGMVELGFGKASITPLVNAVDPDPPNGIFGELPLSGYGAREGKAATGIHDSVFVKSAAIRVGDRLIFLVSADLLIIPPGVTEALSTTLYKTLGISREQVFLSATHTHSSVGAWSEGIVGESFSGPYNPAVVEFLTQRFSAAVEQSYHDLMPGQIGTGSFKAPEFVRNRLVGDLGMKNDDFVFMLMQQNEGKKAVLGSFSGHATTLGAWNLDISGDYPGYWQKRMEERGADLAIFYAGSVGSHSVSGGTGERFERTESLGVALADSIHKYSGRVQMSENIDLGYLYVNIYLPQLHVRVTDGLRLNAYIARQFFPPIGVPSLQAARIGDLIWATTPCDYSGESAIELKNMLAKSGYKGLITSFNGAYVGYIIPCRYYHLNEYESRLMSWFGPYMGPYTQEILRRMMAGLISLTPSRTYEMATISDPAQSVELEVVN